MKAEETAERHHHRSRPRDEDSASELPNKVNQTSDAPATEDADHAHSKKSAQPALHSLNMGNQQSHNYREAMEKHDLQQPVEKPKLDQSKDSDDEDLKLDAKGEKVKDKLQDNSLFNQISGY